MAEMGHEDAFPSPRLSARYRFSQETFPGTRGNERDAPNPAVRGPKFNRQGPPIAVIRRPMLIFLIDNLWWPVSITV